MWRSRTLRTVAPAVPGLALAVVGLTHPHHLTPGTAERWFVIHVVGLVVFPLVGLAVAGLVRGRRDPLAWLVRLGAYLFATFYTALDVISGVAAGYVTRELGAGVPRPEAVSLLFRIGTPLGEIGSWALLATGVLLVLDRVRTAPGAALPGVVLGVGAWLVHVDHIFSPWGVLGCALVGLGTAATARDSDAPRIGRGSVATSEA